MTSKYYGSEAFLALRRPQTWKKKSLEIFQKKKFFFGHFAKFTSAQRCFLSPTTLGLARVIFSQSKLSILDYLEAFLSHRRLYWKLVKWNFFIFFFKNKFLNFFFCKINIRSLNTEIWWSEKEKYVLLFYSKKNLFFVVK